MNSNLLIKKRIKKYSLNLNKNNIIGKMETLLEKIFIVKNDILKFKKKELPFLEQFEVHVCDHCNLNCKGCSHFCPVSDEKFVDIKSFEKDFKCLSKKIRVGRIRLLGGEPLLHKDINRLMKTARKYFPNSHIAICTNGILLPTMNKDFWDTVNKCQIFVDMSKYPALINKFDEYIDIVKKNTSNLGFVNDVEKFGYILNPKGDSKPVETFNKCQNQYYSQANLRNGFFYICARCYIDYFNKFFETNFPQVKGIDIFKNSGDKIIKFLNTHQEACRYCHTNRPTFEWGFSEKKYEE